MRAGCLDRRFAELVQNFEDETLMNELENGSIEACGGGPTVAVLRAARILGADSVKLLHRCNSGDITGDRSGVVGYLSAIAYQRS